MWKDKIIKDFFSSIILRPPSSLCVVLLLGIVLCKLQEHEVEPVNLIITFKGEQNPPSPLVFSFFCLHFMGHVCVDLTIVSRRRWTRLAPNFVFMLAFFMARLCAVLFLCVVLCRLQEHKEEHINHHHRLWRWTRLVHPPFGFVVCVYVLVGCVGYCCNFPFGVVLFPPLSFVCRL